MKRILFFLFLSLSSTVFAQDNLDLFVLAGQSNALGRQGDATGYPADPNNLDMHIPFYWTVADGSSSGDWALMQPQTGFFPAGHFGPEVTFARKLVQAGSKPAIFKYTQGSTSIFQHWQGPGDGGLYDQMVSSLNAAITELQAGGNTVHIRGLIWIQGESDSNSDAAANAYHDNLMAIINDFRANVAYNNNLPILLGVDEQYFNIPDHERHQILNAHQDIALNDEHIRFTSMYGYPKADQTHLTPTGLIAHGEGLFNTFQYLNAGVYPSNSCILQSIGNHNSFERTSWGQSFNTDCSGTLSSITFEATTELNSAATFNLYNGADCSGTILATKNLANIQVGNNTVNFGDNLYIDENHSYYFEIVSDNASPWRVDFNDQGEDLPGVLRCTSDDGTQTCGRTFLGYDMDFTVVLEAQILDGCTLLSSGSEVSFERTSWGQSFSTDCSGQVTAVTFSAASELASGSTFSLYDGNDCNAFELYTTTLGAITIGNNTVNIPGFVYLDENNTYYFQIVGGNDSDWRIHYSNTDIVDGRLTCTSDDGSSHCGRTFPSFDMNFAITIGAPSCPDFSNIYSFVYNNKSYQIVKEAKSWAAAAECASFNGGILAHIDDAQEQAAIWAELNNAGINLSNTIASNGGGASYVWIGGTDQLAEGNWIWDGNNDGLGAQFWSGGVNGNPVDGLYSNWGNEPDNTDEQDALGIALTQWPINTGTLGSAGQWNDLIITDPLYYVVEYPTIIATENIVNDDLLIFPNPVENTLFITTNNKVDNISLINSLGQVMTNQVVRQQGATIEVNFSAMQEGLYFVRVSFENGQVITKKVIK